MIYIQTQMHTRNYRRSVGHHTARLPIQWLVRPIAPRTSIPTLYTHLVELAHLPIKVHVTVLPTDKARRHPLPPAQAGNLNAMPS